MALKIVRWNHERVRGGGEMKTVCIQIGHSDDKLILKDWVAFVKTVDSLVQGFSERVYFFGLTTYGERQNVAWVFDIDEEIIDKFKQKLTARRNSYMQDSIAWVEGETIFI
jgi:hypothetical protein